MGKTQKRNNNVSQKKRSPVRTSLKLRKEKKMKGGEDTDINKALVMAYKAVDNDNSQYFSNTNNPFNTNHIENLTNVTDEQYHTAYDYVKSKTSLNKDIVISPFQYAIIKGRFKLIATVIKDVNTTNLKKTASDIRQSRFNQTQKEFSFKNTDPYSLIFTQGYYLNSKEEIKRLIDGDDTVKKEDMQEIVELFNNNLMKGGAYDDKLNKLLDSISNGNMQDVFEQIRDYIANYIDLAKYFQEQRLTSSSDTEQQDTSEVQQQRLTSSSDIEEQETSEEQQLTLTTISSNIEDTRKEMDEIIINLQDSYKPNLGKQINKLIQRLKLQREFIHSNYENKDDEEPISDLIAIFTAIQLKVFSDDEFSDDETSDDETSDDKTNLQQIKDIVEKVNEKHVNILPNVIIKENKLHFEGESEGLYITDQSLITTPVDDNSSEQKQIENVKPDPIDGNSLINSSSSATNDDRNITIKNINLSNNAATFQFVFYENRNDEAIQTVSILLSIDNGKINVEAVESEAGTGVNEDESGSEAGSADGSGNETTSVEPTVVNQSETNESVDQDANESTSKKAGGADTQVLDFILGTEYTLTFTDESEKVKLTHKITFEGEGQGFNGERYATITPP